MDFTTTKYRYLLEVLLKSGFHFYTFEEYCQGVTEHKFIILRHDVDLKPERSLDLAIIENEVGVKSTYYFRIVPESNQPQIIKRIADLGHEIAYHYEDLTTKNGDLELAYKSYVENLTYFRRFYDVKTISMHGSPTGKYDNRNLWNHYDYRDIGIIGEPYFDFINEDVNSSNGCRFYFTDTGRMWDGDKYNVRDKSVGSSSSVKVKVHSTNDLIRFLITNENAKEVMLNTHPQRWTDNKIKWLSEYFTQKAKNIIKYYLVKRIQKNHKLKAFEQTTNSKR